MLQHSLTEFGLQRLAKGGFGFTWLNLGEVGVVAFFFVSGFVIPLSLEKWNSIPHFLLNRVFRIYPLYLLVYFVALIAAIQAGTSLSIIPFNFTMHVLFVQEFVNTPNFVTNAWTLSLEAVWYLSFTILFFLSLNKNARWYIAGAMIAALVAGALSLSGVVRMPMGRVGMLVVCVLGLHCFRKERGDLTTGGYWIGAVVLTATIAFCLVVGFWLRPSTSPITPSLRCVVLSWALAIAIFMLPFLFRALPVIQNKFVRYLGTISYSIYLVHSLVLLFLAGTSVTGISGVALTVTITIMASALTYRYIEKPAISLSHAFRPALS